MPLPVAHSGPAGPPAASRALVGALSPLEALFDWIFTSRWSPLYQSGALTVLFLGVSTLTGIYLCLFYRIAEPTPPWRRSSSRCGVGAEQEKRARRPAAAPWPKRWE